MCTAPLVAIVSNCELEGLREQQQHNDVCTVN